MLEWLCFGQGKKFKEMLPMEASRVISDYVVGRVRRSSKRILISLGDPLPLMVKNCKPSVLFSNEMFI